LETDQEHKSSWIISGVGEGYRMLDAGDCVWKCISAERCLRMGQMLVD
jgi:hypothetical protein